MAVHLREVTESPVRSTVYKLDGHHYYYEGQVLREASMPSFPPKEMMFDMMFFRQLFDHMAKSSGGSGAQVSVVALRNMSACIMERMQIEDPMTVDFFGDISKKKCSWKDMCKSLLAVGHPRVDLTIIERIFVTLEVEDSSQVAKLWFYLVMTATVANVTVFVWPQLLVDVLMIAQVSDVESWKLYFKTACMSVFTFDYLLKMGCAPFVRLEVVDPTIEYFDMHSWNNRPMSSWERFSHFSRQSTNVIDLLAVLPWWCDLMFGHFLPSSSFLRILRLARVFRIFKSVRHLDMMQVLGMTLWKSMGMVAIVFSLITIIGLIAACVLQQVEHDEQVFTSVLGSWYWTFCRLIGMKDTPNRDGQVSSVWGIAVLACTMTLKGVLWIVPIERIKQIFSKEYADMVQEKNVQTQVVKDVKEIFDISYVDVEHIVKEGPARYVCAMLKIHTREGLITGCVPLPIGKAIASDNTGREMFVDLGDWNATVKLKWTPSDSMKNLPYGQLVLGIVGSKLPSYASEVSWEVLVGAETKHVETVMLERGKAQEVVFDIEWIASGVPDEVKKMASDIHHVHDLDDFQVQVLQLLREQDDMLQEHMKIIGSQSENMATLEKPSK
eukprot:symbB.v1.2.017497.t1/scaffold1358.1/size123611/3